MADRSTPRSRLDDLATTLDLDAGLREATIPARHADLVADLREVLDIEAGPSSILPTTPADSPEADPEETPPDAQLPTDLDDLVRAITSASPAARFAMRTQPTPALDLDLNRAHDGGLTRDLARALSEIHRALNDFTGADLRNVKLAGVSVDGLRRSSTTQYWIEQIERDSVEVEPGIFEVRGGTADVATTVSRIQAGGAVTPRPRRPRAQS